MNIYGLINKNTNLVENSIVSEETGIEEILQEFIDENLYPIMQTEDTKLVYVGGKYENGLFYPPKHFSSWVFDEDLWIYKPPTTPPIDGKAYDWDEDSLSWVEVTLPA